MRDPINPSHHPMTSSPVGIEAITVHVPRYFIDLGTLAASNRVDPAKYTIGLGGRRMAVAAPDEDPVTMAADSASALLDRYGIDPASIGLLVVGSETEVDAAKPIAAYLHRMLGLGSCCRIFDAKHACYSATAGLRMAADWCALQGRGRKALVVATDIARYPVESAGEPTQGAGSVAMLLSDEPRLLALEPHAEAVHAEEVMDFWRPVYQSTALVDGEISIQSYLRAVEQTFSRYEQGSGLGWDDYDHLIFHVPFPKMALKGFRLLYEREVIRRRENARFFLPLETQFELKTLPALWANQELGNVYSGSLYLSLAGLLERAGAKAAGARVGLFSYGSGSCAEFLSGLVGPDASAWAGRIGIEDGLCRRIELGHHQYLHFRTIQEGMMLDGSFRGLHSLRSGSSRRFVFLGVQNHRRIYASLPAEDGLRENLSGLQALPPYAPDQPVLALRNSAKARIGK